MNNLGGIDKLSWYDLVVYNVGFDWISVIVFMIIVSMLTKYMFEKNYSLRRTILVHLIFSFFINYFVFLFAASLTFLFGNGTFNGIFENLSLTHFFIVVEVNFLIYFSMLGIILTYYFIEKANKIALQKANLQASLSQAKLNYLIAQINPHFIFNTLNSISSLIDIDKEKSQDMITNFGDLFRAILDLKNENLIPLRKELKMLSKYMEIISVRFKDDFEYEANIQENVYDILVPALLIQPIIENSFKHGYSLNVTHLKIELNIYRNKEFLHLTVENNGEPLQHGINNLSNSGIGLRNIYDRLETIYGDGFYFSMENKEGELGVCTEVKIPISTNVGVL